MSLARSGEGGDNNQRHRCSDRAVKVRIENQECVGCKLDLQISHLKESLVLKGAFRMEED